MREHGLRPTQKDCASLIGVKQPSVWEWASQHGSPSMENSIKLGEKLGVCVEWILTGRGPKRPGPPMDPHAEALWGLWNRIPPEDRPLVVGYAEGKLRPTNLKRIGRPRLAPPR